MNRYLKNILYTLLFLLGFNTAFALLKFNDSIVEKLVAEGSAKFKQQQLENEEHIKNKEYDKLNFIINLGSNDNLFNYQIVNTEKFIDNTTKEQALNQRLQQLYLNSNNTKQCYLLLISYFDVEIKSTPPDGLTIEDVFKTGKFYNENSDIQNCKWLHHNITDQIINSNTIDKSKHFYLISLGRYRGAFHKNQVGSYHMWFTKKNLPANQTLPSYFNETYDYIKSYYTAYDNKPSNREKMAEDAVVAFEQAYKNAPLKAQILTTYNSAVLKTILQNFTQIGDYNVLSVAERLHILSVFVSESMGENYFGVAGTEGYALNIIKTTSKADVQTFLNGLSNESTLNTNSGYTGNKSNHDYLIKRLISKIDDSFFGVGDDNYTGLINSLKDVFAKADITTTSPKSFWWGVLSNNAKIEEGVNLTADLVNGGKVRVQGFYRSKSKAQGDLTPAEYKQVNETLNPFDQINLTFISEPTLADVGSVHVGKVYKVPAIYLYYVRDLVIKGLVKESSIDVLGLATTPLGFAEIKQAKGLWKAFTIIITSANAIDIVISAPSIKQDILQMDGGADFLHYWNTSLAIANVGYMSPFAIEKIKGFSKSFNKIKNQLQQKLSQQNYNDIKKIDDYYQNNFSEFLDEIPVTSIFASVRTMVQAKIPQGFMNALKVFGKTEDEIIDYFTDYQLNRSGGNFLNDIDNFKTNLNTYNLTDDDIFALYGYTTKLFYKDLNAWLRTGINSTKTNNISTLLNTALSKLPNYTGNKVYRGIEIAPSQINNFISSYSNGSSKIFNDFLSCGGSIQASFGGRAEVNVIFEIQHTTAKEISDLADGIKYNSPPMPRPEILIKGGSQFQVISQPIFDNSIQKWVIKLQQTQ